MTLLLLCGSKQWMTRSLRLHLRLFTKPFTINRLYANVSRHGPLVCLEHGCRHREGAWVLQ